MDYNKLEGKIYGERLGNQAEYWYITAEWIPKDGLGKPKPKRNLLMGPYNSRESAESVAFGKLGNIPFEIDNYPSRDRNKVGQMARARKLNQGKSVDDALQRMKRKV
jgi:hypothetical protein